MEVRSSTEARIAAPVELVWELIDSVESILGRIPEALKVEVAATVTKARIRLLLSWGPVRWTVDGETRLEDVRKEEHLLLVTELPRLDMRFEGAMDLSRLGVAETALSYGGRLTSGRRLIGALEPMFSDLLEVHVQSLVGRVKQLAEQHHQAETRLGEPQTEAG